MTSGNNKIALLEISGHPQSHNPTPPAHVTELTPPTRLTSSRKKQALKSTTFPSNSNDWRVTFGESATGIKAIFLPHTWTFAEKILG